MTALSERPFPDWTPRFGERLVNVCVTEDSPLRVATFVRVTTDQKRRVWMMTDERGFFWNMDPRAMERPETVGGAGHRGVCPLCNEQR